jgi:hypothetical protein
LKENKMTQAMTQETTGKVMTLLGAAMLSMAFLFSVSYTNASFEKTEIAMPSPFEPATLLSAVDNASKSYSDFMYAYVIDSVKQDYALAGENLAWLSDNAKSGMLAMVGIQEQPEISQTQLAFAAGSPVVAGAYTSMTEEMSAQQPKTGGVIQALYSILIQ